MLLESDPSVRRPQDALRNELVSRTVCHAARESDFYRNLYRGFDLEKIRTLDDLSVLPIVSKDQLRTAGASGLCDLAGALISHIQQTSGTTATPFLLYRSVDEIAFIREFFKELMAREDLSSPAPIVLQFPDNRHGTSIGIPGRCFVLQGSVGDDELLEQCLLLLRTRFSLAGLQERVSSLAGSHDSLVLLTDYVIENELSASKEFEIRHIQPVGRYLTSRWRRLFEETWGAEVTDRYSISEIFGGASYCPRCKGYHFDPYVVAEVVEFQGTKAVENQMGTLLLTALHPFAQLQPFIRYRTGDIFSMRRDVCGDTRFEFHGRENHSLFCPLHPKIPLLTGVDVIEVLDAHPEINRDTHSLPLSRVHYQNSLGSPRVHGRCSRVNGKHVFTLRVELSVHLSIFGKRLRCLADQLIQELLQRSGLLLELVKTGEADLRIDFLPPGTLGRLGRRTVLWQND